MKNQSVDIVIPWLDGIADTVADDEEEPMIHISGGDDDDQTHVRPLYLIKRKSSLPRLRTQFREENNRLLFSAFHSYAYYSCDITEMEEKVREHMTRTGAYRFITELNHQHDQKKTHYLNLIDERITLTLNKLLRDRSITLLQWQKMQVNRSDNQQLNSLYFLPDTRRENVPFHPMIDCRHGLTMKISRFLSGLLQAIYDRVSFATTFQTSIDVIDVLAKYAQQGRLRSYTRFATLHIKDLVTSISHEQLLHTLQRFLHIYIIDGYVQGIMIEHILTLVRLFLDHQYLLYDNKLYQQIRGSGFNSPLTTILMNIYVYYWQQDLVTLLNNQKEIFGRYFDELFFTWNESPDYIYALLHTIHQQYPDLQTIITFNKHIHYLDLNIRHLDGVLHTQVAHDSNTEPYALPYVFGHPRHPTRTTLLRTALQRAVCCCTDVFDFANELHDLQLSFQHNGFREDFFIDHCPLFLRDFDVPELKVYRGETYYNQSRYDHLRQKAFNEYQAQKKARIKRFQRQTLQYRWPLSLYHD